MKNKRAAALWVALAGTLAVVAVLLYVTGLSRAIGVYVLVTAVSAGGVAWALTAGHPIASRWLVGLFALLAIAGITAGIYVLANPGYSGASA